MDTDDNSNNDNTNEFEQEGFDVKSALQGRDKKISEQDKQLKELQEKLKALESPSGDDKSSGSNTENSGNSNDGNNSGDDNPLLDMLTKMQAQLDTLQRNSVDAVMNVESALSNEEFVKWADSTHTESWNTQSDTLGERYAKYLEEGNMTGMKRIMEAWNKHASADSLSPVSINQTPKAISAKKKKDIEKADELDKKANVAMRERRFTDAMNFKNEANELRK